MCGTAVFLQGSDEDYADLRNLSSAKICECEGPLGPAMKEFCRSCAGFPPPRAVAGWSSGSKSFALPLL
jgi:hypothetical protein